MVVNRQPPTAVSVFGFEPTRIGNGEHSARELSLQLGRAGWRSVLCFESAPPEQVREFLSLPNVVIEVIPNSWKRAWQPVADLRRILARYHPRTLHFHFTGFLGPYPWLGKLYGVERIFYTDHTSHPDGYMPVRAPFWKRMAARIINAPLTQTICVSDYGYRTLTALDLIDAARVCRIYNGIQTEPPGNPVELALAFRSRYGIPDGRQLVVQVSWIIPQKGIGDLLEAAVLVLAKRQDVHFAIVGEGADRPFFTAEAERMGIASHVTFTGLVRDPFAEGVYAAADIVCQLSRWQEVFGCTITEAMALRRPLVATRVGGIPELVAEEETGLLAGKGDTQEMANHLLRLLGDRELGERMGEAGRRRCIERFELSKNIAEVVKLYCVANTVS